MNTKYCGDSNTALRSSKLTRMLLVTAVLVGALSACANLAPDTRSVYERMGGEPVLTVVVSEMIDHHAASPDGQRSFANVKLKRLKKHIVEQFCALTGGPCTYGGDDMRLAHGGLEITEREFTTLVQALREALAANGVGEREKNELLRMLAPMKRDIVTAGSSARAAPQVRS